MFGAYACEGFGVSVWRWGYLCLGTGPDYEQWVGGGEIKWLFTWIALGSLLRGAHHQQTKAKY